jgi:hypothetical protein
MKISFTFEKLVSYSFKRLLEFLKSLGFDLSEFETILESYKRKEKIEKET